MRFDLSTLDSGERSLPFGLLVIDWNGKYGMLKIPRFSRCNGDNFKLKQNDGANHGLICCMRRNDFMQIY